MTRRHLGLLVALAWPSVLAGQSTADGRTEIFVGSELEQYLRFLQVDGRAGLYPWSIGGFSPREIDRMAPRDSGHPWARHYPLDSGTNDRGLSLIPPVSTTIVNTTFPYGSNDGPIWAGRGITSAVQVGLSARYGPVSLTVAPMVFSAQNAAFQLASNGTGHDTAFADPRYLVIDRPQRFGNRGYTVIDPGQSTLRFDLPGIALGFSTANQRWGPGEIYPILLETMRITRPSAVVPLTVHTS